MSGLITGYDPKTQNFIDTDLFDVSKHVTQTIGVLEVGVSYTILDYQTGDIFTNVGGTNVTGNVFVATGTTPTTYTYGSTLAKYVTQSYTYAELKSGLGAIETLKASLTAAQIKTGLTIPIDIISAPGAGKGIQILSGAARYNYGTVPFDNADEVRIKVFGLSFFQADAIGLAGLTNTQTATMTIRYTGFGLANADVVENAKVQVIFDADSTVGDSTMDVYIQYRIITF